MKALAWPIALLTCLLAACSSPAPTTQDQDRETILELMHTTWDRPDAPLDAAPVVVAGDHAVVDWTQDATGGRALLRRQDGAWVTVLCAGDGIRDAEGSIEAGVPTPHAHDLAHRLAEAEQHLTPERLALMASLKGIVRMPTGGGSQAAHR
jgi:hypothetical protein